MNSCFKKLFKYLFCSVLIFSIVKKRKDLKVYEDFIMEDHMGIYE